MRLLRQAGLDPFRPNPVVDIIAEDEAAPGPTTGSTMPVPAGQRLPQTMTVIGTAYIVGVLIALPIGIYSAYRQYSWFDQLGTLISMIGSSMPAQRT